MVAAVLVGVAIVLKGVLSPLLGVDSLEAKMSSLIFFHVSFISLFPLSTFFGFFVTVVVIYLWRICTRQDHL